MLSGWGRGMGGRVDGSGGGRSWRVGLTVRWRRRKAELIGARTRLPIVLKAAGFFRFIELFSHILDLVALLVDNRLHPLVLRNIVGGAGGGGVKELSLLVEAVFVVAPLLFRPRLPFRQDGELGGGLGCGLSFLFFLLSALLLGVEGLEIFALLLNSSEFLFFVRHSFLSSFFYLFLLLTFAAEFVRRFSCLSRAFFFLDSHQGKDRRLDGRRRDGIGVGGSIAAGSPSSHVVPRRGLG